MMLRQFPSLEFNWLPKAKDVSLPDICFADVSGYSGVYYHPQDREILIGDHFYSLERGLVVCGTDGDPSTIAHEFRHHLQYLEGVNGFNPDWNRLKGSYKEKIVAYYTSSINEMDSLLFEVKHYPTDCNQQWLEYLIKN